MPRTVVRRVAVAVAVGALVLLAWTAVALALARGDLLDARAALEAARDADTAADARTGLDDAGAHLRRASGLLGAPGPRVTAALPLVGRTPEAVRTTTEATLATTAALEDVLRRVDEGSPLLAGGRVDLDRAEQVEAALRRAADSTREPVGALARVETGLVPSPVTDGVRTARDTLLDVPDQLASAAEALAALRSAAGADEPRRLLVVLQNNAELRGTGGLVSVFAEVRADRGRLEVGEFRDVVEVADPVEAVRRVPAPPDFTALFGPLLADSTLWKNTNADPDVPTSSAVLARVAGATLDAAPDGVLWLDVPALAAVLGATSPAVLPDGTQIGADAVDKLLSGAYEGVPDEAAAQEARRARLRATADAVAERLLGDAPDLPRLARALSTAADGRHVAVWSRDEDEQRAWERAGLAAPVAAGDGDLASFTVHNLGGGGSTGNKLDYYARRSVTVRVELHRDEAVVEREVVLRNLAPGSGLPVYVAGPERPGTTRNLVLHSLPPRAEVLEYVRGESALVAQPRPLGDSVVLGDAVELPPGTSTSWRLRYRVPLRDGRYELALVPQPLAVDADLTVEVRAVDGLRLALPPGSPLTAAGDDVARLSEPFAAERSLAVRAEQRGLLSRAARSVREFWTEPVQLPG